MSLSFITSNARVTPNQCFSLGIIGSNIDKISLIYVSLDIDKELIIFWTDCMFYFG